MRTGTRPKSGIPSNETHRSSQPTQLCVRCQTTYPDGVHTCERDGGRLIRFSTDAFGRVGEKIDGKVTLLGLLGKGGMGTVYRALQHSMEREVALKLLKRSFADDPSHVQRFLREARTASKLNHPNIITLFDFGQTEDGELYLMMELLRGKELGVVLQNRGRLPADRAVKIAVQVCDAVQHAHDNGIIHRDIKPDNVFLLDSAVGADFVKVLDFGIARSFDPGDNARLTETGLVCGTPAYMAPEQAMGEAADERADVYAIAVMTFELLSGRLPFPEDSPMKALLAQINTPAPLLTERFPGYEIPDDVARVIHMAMNKKPDHRPQSAAEFGAILRDALNGESDGTRSFVRPPESPVYEIDRESLEVGATLDAIPIATPTPSPAPTILGRPTLEQELGATLAGRRIPQSPLPNDGTPVDLSPPPSSPTDTGTNLEPGGSLPSRRVPRLAVAAVVLLAAGGLAWSQLGGKANTSQPSAAAPKSAPAETSKRAPAPAAPAEPTAPSAAAPAPAPVATTAPDSGHEPGLAVPMAPVVVARPAELSVTGGYPRRTLLSSDALPVRLQVTSTPAGAKVSLGGTPLGETPLELPPITTEAELVVERRGYRPVRQAVTPDMRDAIALVLKKKASGKRSPRDKSNKGPTKGPKTPQTGFKPVL